MPNLEERSLAHFLSWSVGPVGMKEPGAYGDFFEKFLFNSLNKLKLAAQRAGESRGRDTRLCVWS